MSTGTIQTSWKCFYQAFLTWYKLAFLKKQAIHSTRKLKTLIHVVCVHRYCKHTLMNPNDEVCPRKLLTLMESSQAPS